jgi:hypothetical protein
MQDIEPRTVRRPVMPPKRPLFGIRVHPVVAVSVALALVGIAALICLAARPDFLPEFNPFAGGSPFRQ